MLQILKFRIFAPIFLLIALSINLAHAERIAVIGTGSVAGALGPEFAALGHEVVYGSRSPAREDVLALVKRTGESASVALPSAAVEGAGMVVLAVPGSMVEEITSSLGNLAGKIIIDPTNPLAGWEEDNVRLLREESNAQIIQRTAPDSFVVKAFSTLNVKQMVSPEQSGGPISILLAGNDEGAKNKVAALVTGMGLEPIDVGSLDAAKHVEGMAILLLNNRIQGRERFDFYLRKE